MVRAGIAWVACAGLLACGDDDGERGGDGAPRAFAFDEGARVTGRVTPEAGGTLEAPTADRLEIPAGAVPEAVEVTLVPLVLAEGDALLGGVRLEPDGLVLAAPARLTLALAAPVEAEELRLAESFGAEVAEFGDSGALFSVDASGETASGEIHGFSAKAVAKNCHAGTRDAVLTAWDGVPGRAPAAIAAATGVDEDALATCQLDADPLQRMLAPFFAECGAFPPGQPLSAHARMQIAETVAAGRQVVLLFGPDLAPGADGTWRGVAHSAVVVAEGDRLIIRNQINITSPATLRRIAEAGGTTTVDRSLDTIDQPGDGLRDTRAGELYAETTGAPFSAARRAARPQVWPHVVAWCEQPREAADGDPCCIESGNCPSETGDRCPGDCCCCGLGEVCQPETSACGPV